MLAHTSEPFSVWWCDVLHHQTTNIIGIGIVSNLAGKVVAITGGGTGIGAGIARELAMAGCKVVVGGRRTEPLETLAQTIQSEHPVRTHAIDVADPNSITAFFAFVRDQVGEVDILVNSAGINIQNRTMAAMVPEDWDRVMQINASGAYRCILEVLPKMRERRDGVVINISSIAGKRAISLGGVVYCASKFAMTALGTAISNEVRNEGVRVTNVYPGEVNTPILDNRPVAVTREHKDAILQPEDIAALIGTICQLPPRAHVPEIVIKPTIQEWV
ncbi:SDR family NAD(P)-dependent oxidoreductase [Novipirellula rosea]|uniref:SDR family NAD(P)-dependent oxidoreductase n=1 Tax=Novipirellula rosea TaxID=1031540 RepID=A0ABP8MAV7_9BACT